MLYTFNSDDPCCNLDSSISICGTLFHILAQQKMIVNRGCGFLHNPTCFYVNSEPAFYAGRLHRANKGESIFNKVNQIITLDETAIHALTSKLRLFCQLLNPGQHSILAIR